MATCLDLAKIAFAAYYPGPNQYYEDPSGHMVDDWVVQHWKTGTFSAPAMKHVLKAANFNIFKPQMMLRTLKAKSADDTAGVNFRIRGLGADGVVRTDLVSAHGIAGGHVGMVVDLPSLSRTGAHGKDTCWQAVLGTDWSDVDPFGA